MAQGSVLAKLFVTNMSANFGLIDACVTVLLWRQAELLDQFSGNKML